MLEPADPELLGIVRQAFNESAAEETAGLSTQRELGYRAYYGAPYGNEKKGRSQHISMDVLDSVESIKAVLMETFLSSRQVVKFKPMDADDVDGAELGTAYAQKKFMVENSGYQIIEDVIHDALVAKVGVARRQWIDESEDIELPPMTAAELEEIEADPRMEIDPDTIEAIEDILEGTMWTATVKIRRGRHEVVVPAPEDIRVDPRAETIEDSQFVFERMPLTRSDLARMDLSHDDIEHLLASASAAEGDLYETAEKTARGIIDGTHSTFTSDGDVPQRQITAWMVHIWVDTDDDDIAELWKFIWIGDYLMDAEEPGDMPYRAWTPYRLSHKIHGMSVADVAYDIQKSRTSLARAIIDNQMITNNPRSIANLGRVKNPRDLIEGRIGAVIETDAQDLSSVVYPVPGTPLSPLSFQTMEMLAQEKEARTGQSRVSQGLNGDAISAQNSDRLIERLSAQGQRRVMLMARDFANMFLGPLMRDIHNIGVQNDKQRTTVEVSGDYIEATPAEWGARTEFSVHVALTPDEAKQQAMVLMSLHSTMMQDQNPDMAMLYGMEERYALLTDVFELLGHHAEDRYLAKPDGERMMQRQQAAQQAQQQAMQMQAQMAEREFQLKDEELSVRQFEAASKAGVADMKLALEALTKRTDATVKGREQDRKEMDTAHDNALDDAEFQWKQQVEAAEVAIEHEQKRQVGIGNN